MLTLVQVIHAGLYYGPDSLKTKLCIRGKGLLYDLCAKHRIPHRKIGKWIVAQDDKQLKALEKIHEFSKQVKIPTRFLSKKEASKREPDVRAEAGVLESPTTGIVDSHALMQFLQGDFEDRGGICAFKSPVIRVFPIDDGRGGWEITTRTETGQDTHITADNIINSAGLNAVRLSNRILPKNRQRTAYFAKGTYYSYWPSAPKPSTLIYPAPVPGHGGLGTHLTLDMAGRIRFGPDVQWTDDPTDYTPNRENFSEAVDEIQSYLPGISRGAIDLDYVGIRPKLGKEASATSGGKGFQDFYIEKEKGYTGFVNMLGIESPGLTSCLAIGERVEELLYR